MSKFRLGFLSVVLTLLATPSVALEGLDFSAYADAKTIMVVTNDEDGDRRETTIWIVVVEGAAYINTGNTTWGENIKRTPRVEVQRGESARLFDVVFVKDRDLRHKIQTAFREKYGFQDKLIGLFYDASEVTLMRLAAPAGA